MKKVIIIWAWPWWLTSWMILSSKWYDVQIYEKADKVWWRNSSLQLWDYKFDLWPTFLMYLEILENVFKLSWKDVNDYLEIIRLDPLYKLLFPDWSEFFPRQNVQDTKIEIAKQFPQQVDAYQKYIDREEDSFEVLTDVLKRPFWTISNFFTKRFFKLLPKMDIRQSLYDRLSHSFSSPNLKLAMSFQSKYLWMSPRSCPAVYSLISYLEHVKWIFHVKWWLNEISNVMWKIILENWWKIHVNSPVKEIIVKDKKAIWIELESWTKNFGDYVIINADFAYAMSKLIDPTYRNIYSDKKLSKKNYSCSTYMFYLWLDKQYTNLNHHNIVYNNNYKEYIDRISTYQDISQEYSLYIHNPSILDPTLAPSWHSSLYILIPAPNNNSQIDWNNYTKKIEENMFKILHEKFGIDDIQDHIIEKKIITPNQWENEYNIYLWAVFNLSHQLTQMLYFRPHNKFQELDNVYLVGWWTHPWSWLPTIYQSWIISSQLIMDND